jgi:flagella basal body P-ring formation protein FlgA
MTRLTALLFVAALTLPAAAQSTAPAPLPFAARFASLNVIGEPQARRPTLKSAVTVTGDIVRIGDLLDDAGPAASVPIFRAPDLGQTGSVAVTRIVEALAPHEIADPDTRGLVEVIVTRASRAIDVHDIEGRIVRSLAARHRIADASSLTVTFDAEPATFHVEPDAELRIARLSYEPRSGRFDMVFEVPGAKRRLVRFTGSYAETFEAIVVTRPVGAGVALKASDLKIVRRPKAEYAANTVTESTQAVGLAARQPLRPGQVLRQTDLTKPEVVARNESVTITYQVPGITLSMRGKATEGGAQGDIISVLNIQSKRTIQATVAGPGHVIVVAPARATVVAVPPPPRVAAKAAPANIHPHARVRAE